MIDNWVKNQNLTMTELQSDNDLITIRIVDIHFVSNVARIFLHILNNNILLGEQILGERPVLYPT